MTPKTSRKTAASMHLNATALASFLREDFQTIYAEIMVARGHLAAMQGNARGERLLNIVTKLMDLTHESDALLSEAEDLLNT